MSRTFRKRFEQVAARWTAHNRYWQSQGQANTASDRDCMVNGYDGKQSSYIYSGARKGWKETYQGKTKKLYKNQLNRKARRAKIE